MKNEIEQNYIEGKDKMRFKFLVSTTGFEKPFAETWASSLSEAQRNILYRKDEFRQKGVLLFSMGDVEKLFFRKEEVPTVKTYWWQEN